MAYDNCDNFCNKYTNLEFRNMALLENLITLSNDASLVLTFHLYFVVLREFSILKGNVTRV